MFAIERLQGKAKGVLHAGAGAGSAAAAMWAAKRCSRLQSSVAGSWCRTFPVIWLLPKLAAVRIAFSNWAPRRLAPSNAELREVVLCEVMCAVSAHRGYWQHHKYVAKVTRGWAVQCLFESVPHL